MITDLASSQRRRHAVLLGLALVTLLSTTALPSAAQDTPISVEMLTPRAEFTDDVHVQIRHKLDGRRTNVLNLDPSRIAVARITVQPGAAFPWHTHPGAVMAVVAQGELIYVNSHDCVKRSYPAGDTFLDPGHGNVHTAYNPTDQPTVVMATFLGIPDEGPLTIPVAPADQPYEGCTVTR